MLDLFGDSVTYPQTVPHSKNSNSAFGFVEFWQLWPSGPRKVAKQQCINKWATLGCADVAGLIHKHVTWLKTQEDWLKGFIPMPCTYLNQQRWVDWEPVEVKPVPRIDPALAKILADEKKAAPIPENIREKLQSLRRTA